MLSVLPPLAGAAQPHVDSLVAHARQSLADGASGQAYALLITHEQTYAGEPDFDYWLGQAALDNDHPSEATLALERATIRRPAWAAARLALGRAHFALGNWLAAKNEFNHALSLALLPAERQRAEGYLAQIRQRQTADQRISASRLEWILGYDDNINTATAAETVAGLGDVPFQLSENSRQQNSTYAQLAFTTVHTRPLHGAWQGFAGASVKHKEAPNAHAYGSSEITLQGGVLRKSGNHSWVAGAQAGKFYLDDDPLYFYGSGFMNWQYQLAPGRRIHWFARHTQVNYTDGAAQSNDFTQTMSGIGGVLEKQHYALWLNGYGGWENTAAALTGDRTLAGVSAGIGVPLHKDLTWRANLAWQHKQYQNTLAFFGTARDDKYLNMDMELEWRFQPAWGIALRYAHTHNQANIELYHYERNNVSLILFHTF